MENTKPKFPTEMVELPSKGLLYPEGHPLASGQVEMKYMTAKEEDILTNQNYLKQGTVIDKLLQSLIVTKFNYDDLLVGDKNAILIAARILGYGKDYSFNYSGEEISVDLSLIPTIYLEEEILKEKGVNALDFEVPTTGDVLTFKLLTGHDEKAIDAEVKGMKRVNKNADSSVSTRLKHQIIAINGDDDKKKIREFVDNYFLARDSAAFRSYLRLVNPDVKMTFIYEGENSEKEVAIPMEAGFLWPDTRV